MERRAFLATVVAGTSGLAGCAGLRADRPGTDPATVESRREEMSPVPERELTRATSKDGIPAITEPAFGENWADVRIPPPLGNRTARAPPPALEPDDPVLSVKRGGAARAYPLRVLAWHEVVNDSFDGPLLVTYCPLCGSGVTAVRTVDGVETVFGVSGYLWRSNLVLYDQATESLWSQIEALAIRGPETGQRLTLVPSSIRTWAEFRDDNPDGTVLLPPPKSGTIVGGRPGNYRINPYDAYADSERIGVGENEFTDDRLHPKTTVVGVTHGGVAKAYPLPVVAERGVVNDEVNGLAVVVAVDADESLVAYERTVGGTPLTFAPVTDSDRYMIGGGSRFRVSTGTAVDGPHEGTSLTRANERSSMFWFAWLDFHQDTELYDGGKGGK